MADIFESESFVLPSQVCRDVAGRLNKARKIQSLEMQWRGEALESAKSFGDLLLGLKKRGVKVSHDVTIRLDFPRSVSREKVLELVELMPKPRNGSVKVRIHS